MNELFNSVREEHAYSTICKLHDAIVGKCKKCNNGFIENNVKNINSPEELLNPKVVPCECYIKYKKHSLYLISGIQREFWEMKDADLLIDDESKKKLNIYIKHTGKAYEKGLGILFLGSRYGIKEPNSGVGKTSSGVKVLLNAIELNKTVHYITQHQYFNLVYKSKQDNTVLPFIDEIEGVDFLLIDEIGKINATEYVKAKFEDLVRDRASKLLPTILVTNMNKAELNISFGESLMDIMKNTMVEISIKRNDSYRERRFIDIKKGVSNEL